MKLRGREQLRLGQPLASARRARDPAPPMRQRRRRGSGRGELRQRQRRRRGTRRWRTPTPSTAACASSRSSPPSSSVTRAMWCARRAVKSLRQRAGAMFAALPRITTTGATPWSAWWSPSVSHARMQPMAVVPGQLTTISMSTARRVHMHHAAAQARTAASLVLQRRSWTTSPAHMDGLPPPRSEPLRHAAFPSTMDSTSSSLRTMRMTMIISPLPAAAVGTCYS